MRVQSRSWFDFDPVSLLILLAGIAGVALVAFSI
jgi:hypothetical protein